MKWTYGVTTVRERIDTLLPKTLDSLKAAGFDNPTLFVDDPCPEDWDKFNLEVVPRSPKIGTYGNWLLAAWELWIRDPVCHRYAIFQDDVEMSKNARQFCEHTYPKGKFYLNLYTYPPGRQEAPPSEDYVGWFKSNQLGRGALALVFTDEALATLLSSTHMVNRARAVHDGNRTTDGAIATAMKYAGYAELVHQPSICQHTGITTLPNGKKISASTMGNQCCLLSYSYMGKDFDMMSLVR